MASSMSSKLPRSGTLITLLTDCGKAVSGSLYRVLYTGRHVLLLGVHDGSECVVSVWELDAAHFTVGRV